MLQDPHGDNCFPTYEQISKRTGISRRQITRSILRLIDQNVIVRLNNSKDATIFTQGKRPKYKLSTDAVQVASNRCQIGTGTGAKLAPDRCQFGTCHSLYTNNTINNNSFFGSSPVGISNITKKFRTEWPDVANKTNFDHERFKTVQLEMWNKIKYDKPIEVNTISPTLLDIDFIAIYKKMYA